MAELQIGDMVQVAPGVFSEVYMFSHRYVNTVSAFVKITTSTGAALLITADHYLYVNGALQVAATIKVGHSYKLTLTALALIDCNISYDLK